MYMTYMYIHTYVRTYMYIVPCEPFVSSTPRF